MVAAGVKEDVYAAAGGLPLGSQLAEALVKQGVQSRHGSGHLATVRPAPPRPVGPMFPFPPALRDRVKVVQRPPGHGPPSRSAPRSPPARSAWTGSELGSAPPRNRPPAMAVATWP